MRNCQIFSTCILHWFIDGRKTGSNFVALFNVFPRPIGLWSFGGWSLLVRVHVFKLESLVASPPQKISGKEPKWLQLDTFFFLDGIDFYPRKMVWKTCRVLTCAGLYGFIRLWPDCSDSDHFDSALNIKPQHYFQCILVFQLFHHVFLPWKFWGPGMVAMIWPPSLLAFKSWHPCGNLAQLVGLLGRRQSLRALQRSEAGKLRVVWRIAEVGDDSH